MSRNRMHLKRHSMPTSWPVGRKTITFIARPSPGAQKREYAVSIWVILKDVLGYVQNARECRYALHNTEVLVNSKRIKDLRFSIGLFDTVEIKATKEKYTVLFDNLGKIKLVPAKDDLIYSKLLGKVKIAGGKFQLNFFNGFNTLVDEKTFKNLNINDTVVYDPTKKKIVSTIPLKAGTFVYIFDGNFKGQFAELKNLIHNKGLTRDIADVQIGKEEHKTALDYCYVLGSKKEDLKRFE